MFDVPRFWKLNVLNFFFFLINSYLVHYCYNHFQKKNLKHKNEWKKNKIKSKYLFTCNSILLHLLWQSYLKEKLFFKVLKCNNTQKKKKRLKDKICTATTLQLIVKRKIASEDCLFKTWQDGRKIKKQKVNIYLNPAPLYC